MHNTIIFDLDGTLLDTLDDLTTAVNYALRKHYLPKRSKDEVRQFLGNGMERLIELSVPKGKKTKNFKTILQDFKAYYLVNAITKTAPYPGIMDMLNTLKQKGFKLAIVSNKGYQAVSFLREYFFNETIDVAIGEKEGIRKKPFPDTVYEALNVLNEEKQNAYYVGDSEVDILTAKNAGMQCLSVSWGFRTKEELQFYDSDLIFDNPTDLLNYIIDNN
ncbi:MAG: HAD family hydrolase [Bacilli bacterium]|nr:HAD family hydrolase [Mollicutes bacterium]MDY3899166.1 HAD family hydrolase [Bacilli bacterium]